MVSRMTRVMLCIYSDLEIIDDITNDEMWSMTAVLFLAFFVAMYTYFLVKASF